LVPVLSTLLEDPVHRRQTAWPYRHPQAAACPDQVVLDPRGWLADMNGRTLAIKW